MDYHKMVFERYTSGNWEIYVMNSLYSNATPHPLTAHTAADFRPSLSPDTARVAFTSDRDGNYEIYTMDSAGGGNLARLTADSGVDVEASWSPDGQHLVFQSDRDGNYEIYRMNKDGSDQVRLTADAAADFDPVWSRDGTKIYWIRVVSSNQGVMMSMDTDGGAVQAVTPPLYYLESLAWAPRTDRILFDYDGNGDGWFDLGLINADGTGLTLVVPSVQGYDFLAGTWSGNESHLIFTYVQYDLIGGVYYIQNAFSRAHAITPGNDYDFNNSYLDFYPNARSTDSSIPESRVNNLPEYSRADGFTVTWEGSDPGPAPICSFYVESRKGTSGPWNLWEFGPHLSGWFDTGNPGEQIYFRSQTVDEADNWEAWPPGSGDTHTTLYAWKLDGLVLDDRGQGIAGAAAQTIPAALNSDVSGAAGEFDRYNLTAPISVNVSSAGYGPLPATAITTTGNVDQSHWWPLPPVDDLIANGNFESPLSGLWNSSGAIAPQAMWNSHSGDFAAELGWPFDRGGKLDISGQAAYLDHPGLTRSADGTIHAVASYRDSGPSGSWIGYLNKPAAGSWSSIVPINPGGTPQSQIPDLEAGADGTVHVAWMEGFGIDASIEYAERDPGGSWSPVENISGPRNIFSYVDGRPELEVDSFGGVHVVWGDQYGLWYSYKPSGGVWAAPETIVMACCTHGMTIDSDDQLHLVSSHSGGYYDYRFRPLGGSWSTTEPVAAASIYSPDLAISPDGSLHLAYQDGGDLGYNYTRRTPAGTWTSPAQIVGGNTGIYYNRMSVGADGRAHFTWAGPYGLQYRLRFGDGTWSDQYPIDKSGLGRPGASTNPDGSADLLWLNLPDPLSDSRLIYQTVELPVGGNSMISQTVYLPSSLHQPTLSLSYLLEVTGNAGDFQVDLNGSPVLTSSSSTDGWQHHWVDMAPWAGQTVTVTLSTAGTFKGGHVTAYVDEISLGEWLTPVITGISPSHLPDLANAVITISGENFIQTATVRLDESTLLATTWVDEHTLTAVIPPGAQLGWHDAWVLNPGGQGALVSDGLLLGSRVHLPLIRKPYLAP